MKISRGFRFPQLLQMRNNHTFPTCLIICQKIRSRILTTVPALCRVLPVAICLRYVQLLKMLKPVSVYHGHQYLSAVV